MSGLELVDSLLDTERERERYKFRVSLVVGTDSLLWCFPIVLNHAHKQFCSKNFKMPIPEKGFDVLCSGYSRAISLFMDDCQDLRNQNSSL